MHFTFDYNRITLPVGRYQTVLRSLMMEALIQGGKRWMTTALNIIPVWAGASHGTFLKLAQKLNESLTITAMGGFPGVAGPTEGKQQSHARITVFDNAYMLEYGTTLFHLVYNEYNNANSNPVEGRVVSALKHPGPYNFQNIANAVFASFAKSIQLPSPWRFLTLKLRSVG